MKVPIRKHLVLSLMTLVIPGIGRLFTGQILNGVIRLIAFILMLIVQIEPWYINLIVKISLWSWVVSSELRYIDKALPKTHY